MRWTMDHDVAAGIARLLGELPPNLVHVGGRVRGETKIQFWAK